MFTSDKEKANGYADSLITTAFLCLSASVFCALFGGIYEIFSHGVYSFFMIYAFAIPLVLGVFPLLVIILRTKKKEDGTLFCMPGGLSLSAWFAGIATLTVGSIFEGVLKIYGTTNRKVAVYPVAGGILLLIGVVSFIISCRTAKRTFRNSRVNADNVRLEVLSHDSAKL